MLTNIANDNLEKIFELKSQLDCLDTIEEITNKEKHPFGVIQITSSNGSASLPDDLIKEINNYAVLHIDNIEMEINNMLDNKKDEENNDGTCD